MKNKVDINCKLMLFVILIYFSFPSLLFPAKYYVDYQNGNNNNNGLTIQTAFKHCPGDVNATGVPAGINLTAGDTVIFRGGVEYLGQVLIDGDGTATDSIVFIGNSGWGSGRAIFNLQNTRQYAFKGGRDYIKIQGFNIYNYASAGSDYAIYPSSGASHWLIDSCTVAFVQDWNSISTFPDKAAILLSNSISNITIRNCEFFASGRTTIKIRYASNINILDNDFGGLNRGDSTGWFSVAIRGEVNGSNVVVRGNRFHDAWQYGGDVNPELQHAPAYMHIYGDATNYPRNWTIERNYFYNDRQLNTGSGTGSIELTTNCRSFHIRNNVIVNDIEWWGGAILLATACDSIWVENNTIINRDYLTTSGANINIVIYTDATNKVGDSIWVRNNIFWNDDDRIVTNIRFTGLASNFKGVLDYNAYFKKSGGYVYSSSSGSGSLAGLQSFGFEAHGQFYEVPTYGTGAWTYFMDIPSSPANSSSGNYRLSSLAPTFLKTGGYDASLRFTNDFDGNTRTSGWSIGAYEYVP